MHLISKSLPFFFILLINTSCNKENKIISQKKTFTESGLPKMVVSEEETQKISEEEENLCKTEIVDFYKKNWPENKINGGFLVAKNGKILFEKYGGFANFNNNKPISANTPLHIASVSKVITATAVLKLVDAKMISLDDPVDKYLNQFPYPEVTIRMLLAHRSGIRCYSYFTDRDKGVWDRSKILGNDDILDILSSKDIKLERQPDSGFSYCNTNYAILASIIERVTKLSYPDAMRQMIFKPLGMKNSFVFEYEKHKDTVALSFKSTKIAVPFDYLDKVYGDKNIYSTPRDLLIFDRARSSSTFLDPVLNQQIYTGYSNERPGRKNYGLGIRMLNLDNGKNFYFHNGWWHGFTSSFISLADEDVTIIALSNKFTRRTYDVRKVASIFGDYPFKLEDQ